ncbi:hypothetical protein EIP91_006660 [Steccherinum ochraceum]|uniref:BTB domain-containing protein n=1 Tax=Steccherinum ochraceum TaxID=92696 RepID=A0A4R0R7V4_9APHY|nr:hypothetical protein EIP91_006660 [Steccherinum ochraceum]
MSSAQVPADTQLSPLLSTSASLSTSISSSASISPSTSPSPPTSASTSASPCTSSSSSTGTSLLSSISPSTSPSPSKSVITKASAPAPFDTQTVGSVALRSSEGTDFFVPSTILTFDSPILKALLAQDKEGEPLKVTDDGFPIILVPELTDDAMLIFLHLVCPIAEREFDTLGDILSVLKAGKRLSLSIVKQRANASLESRLASECLRVYATGCSMGMEDEAKAAADHMLKTQIFGNPFSKDMGSDRMVAGVYHRLIYYLYKGGAVSPGYTFVRPLVAQPQRRSITNSDLTERWASHLDSTVLEQHPTDLLVYSSSDPKPTFWAHAAILSIFSPVLSTKISKRSEGETSLPTVISLPESAEVVHAILEFAYGAAVAFLYDLFTGDRTGIPLMIKVAQAAIKYAAPTLIATTKKVLQYLQASTPLDAYFMAVQCGWKAEARKAALAISDSDGPEYPYVACMEDIPSKSYFNLLKFRAEVRVKVKEVVKRLCPELLMSIDAMPKEPFLNVPFPFYFAFHFGSRSSQLAIAGSPEGVVNSAPTALDGKPKRKFFGIAVPADLSQEKMHELETAVSNAVGEVTLDL